MALDKTRGKEEEFFIKMEAEKLRKTRAKLDEKRQEAAKESKTPHWMKCPKCGHDLEEKSHGSVMIDQCKKCKGIWLDAGELELIVEGGADAGFFGKLFGKK